MLSRLFFVLLTLVITLIGCTREQNFDEKVLNLVTPAKFKGYDPAFAADLYSGNEVGKVYEGLLEFHYLKRPYELTPNLAEAMPTVSTDGLTYTFKLRKDVKFHDSECFPEGKGRQMKADDVVFSIKRLADPKIQSTGWWLVDGKLAGLNEWREKYSSAEVVNYNETVEGIKKIDDFTVQFKLVKPFPQFLYALAMPFTSVVPKEAIDKYGIEFQNYPVGTGPYTLKYFDNSNKIIYNKNPNFRDKRFPTEGDAGDEAAGLLADAGKKLPLADKIIVNIQIESQPRWLEFQKGNSDLIAVPKDNFDQAIDRKTKTISTDLQKKGVRLNINPALDVTYIAFNHEDPLFKNNLKLRKAMSLAYGRDDANKLFYSGTAFPAQSIIPPGLAGNKKDFKNPWVEKNVEMAKKLLAEAGYPGGKGLPAIRYDINAGTESRQLAEYFAKQMGEVGIKIQIITNTWPELVKKTNNKSTQIFGMAWGADYPDAENFLGLLYGPNGAPGSNSANYKNAEFDKLFAQAVAMQDTPERTTLYEKLNEMAAEDVPWIFAMHRTEVRLIQGWLRNFKYIEFNHAQAQYLSVDLEVKKELLKKF